MPIVYGVNYMNTQLQQEIQEARETFIGRIFTFGGSVLFLIGSFLAVITAYKAYNRLLNIHLQHNKKDGDFSVFLLCKHFKYTYHI